MYGGLLYLYQNNILSEFFTSTGRLSKITNPNDTQETHEVVGVIDSLFKVITNELMYLFYMLYLDGKQIQIMQPLYAKLPMEYKNIFYQIRGLLFHKQKVGTGLIQLKDIYNLLKTIDISMLKSFIRARQLMLNWSKLEQSSASPSLESTQFADCLRNEEKLYKLSDIYIKLMFSNVGEGASPPIPV